MKRRNAPTLPPDQAEKKTRPLYWWLLVALFFEYARPASYVPAMGVLPLNSVIPLLLFVVCCFAEGLRPNEQIFGDKMSKYLLAFVVLVFISMLHADVTTFAYDVFTLILGYLFMAYTIVRLVTTEARMRGVFLTLIAAHVFLLIMNPEVVTDPSTRHYIVGATFLGDGNDYSLSVCILIPFAIELLVAYRSALGRLLGILLLVVLLLAIIGTQSRGATLGMAAVFGYLWVYSSRKLATLAAAFLVACVLLLYAPDVYFERMGTIANYQSEGSAMGRIEAWKAGLRMAADNPVLGVAAGHYPIAFGTTYRPPGLIGTPWLTAHSMYFLVLGELGLPGIFVVLALVIGNIRANTRVRQAVLTRHAETPSPELAASARVLNLLSGAMAGFAVAAAFLSVAYYPHLFVLTALFLSARQIALNKIGLTALPVQNPRAERSRRSKASRVPAPTSHSV